MKIGESSFLQFSIFSDSVSCFEKRVKAYLYGQGVLSEDDAENDLVTLRDCGDFHSISRVVVPLDYSLWNL